MNDFNDKDVAAPALVKAGRVKYCPYDGSTLQQKTKYCYLCRQTVSVQPKPPRKPRNFYEPMPEGIEDNYVDELFLKGLFPRNSFPELHYTSMVRQTAEILHVCNSLTFLIASFQCLYSWENADDFCIILTAVVLMLTYMIHFACNPDLLNVSQVFDDMRLFMFLSLILAFLTPVLQSLTVTFSDDTIILFVFLFSFFHLLLYDYQLVTQSNKDIASASSPTSLNAIFFAAILMASRLTRISSVFVLLFQSLLIFGFGPYFRQELRRYSREMYEAFAIVSTVFNFILIFLINNLASIAYLAIAAFISFGGPLLFIYAYKFKNDIRGPWDVPNVKQYSHVN